MQRKANRWIRISKSRISPRARGARSNSASVISHAASSCDVVVFSVRYNRPDPRSGGLSATHNSLLALAIGAGSVFFCHVNDAGFSMVREYFGLQPKQTVFVWSILQTIVSVAGLASRFVMWGVLA